jgi:hypothetical protein
MRKEHARQCRDDSPTAQPAAGPPDNESNDREAEELSKLVGLDGAEVAPSFSSADAPTGRGATTTRSESAGLKVSATTESPKEENATETPKSPEQSENVTENKGPAAEEARG